MIRGTVFPNRQALLAVALLDTAGQFQSFEFILDTGFDGDLSLPRQTLQRLEILPEGRLPVELADGSRTTAHTVGGHGPLGRGTAYDYHHGVGGGAFAGNEPPLGKPHLPRCQGFRRLGYRAAGVTPGRSPCSSHIPYPRLNHPFPVAYGRFSAHPELVLYSNVAALQSPKQQSQDDRTYGK